MAHGNDPQIPASGQIIVNQQTNLAAFYNAKLSSHQLEPDTSGDSRKDAFQNKSDLSNTKINLNKIEEKESETIMEQYRKFSMRTDSPQTGWIKEPFIMRGIQRNNIKKPAIWGSFGISPYIHRGGEIFGQPHGLVRGGISVVERSVIDGLRIAKFMVGGPKGLLFIAQQIGLQLTAPKLEQRPVLGWESLGQIAGRPTRVYNPATTLLQIAGNAAGLHLTRHGIIPGQENTDANSIQRYAEVAKSRNEKSELYTRNADPIGRTLNKDKAGNYKNSYNRLLNMMSDAFYPASVSKAVVKGGAWPYLSAPAGPASTYGIGKTDIVRVEITDDKLDQTNIKTLPAGYAYNGMSNINRVQAITAKEINSIIDFRVYKTGKEALPANPAELDPYRKDGGDSTISKGFGYSKTTVKDAYELNGKDMAESLDTTTRDEIGIVNSDRSGEGNTDSYTETQLKGAGDLIELRFSDIDKDKNIMVFRCTLAGITDTFAPEWSETTYMGRAEPVWHYKGSAARKIGSGFTAYAINRTSLRSMYQKLNRLAGYTMPKYESGNFNQMSAPLMRMTIGDYIVNQPGFLSSLTYNIEEDMYWETTNTTTADGRVSTYRVPRAIKVDFEYTIIEKDLVQRYKNNFGTKDWLDRV